MVSSSNGGLSSAASAMSLPTLSQIVALTLTYQPILRLLKAIVFVVLAVPMVYQAVVSRMLDHVTRNHTILSLLLTVAATHQIRNHIQRGAPTEQNAQASLRKVDKILPLGMFVVSTCVIRFLIAPLEDLGFVPRFLKDLLTWSPMISFTLALRLALGMLLLGVAVILRFVGSPSIVRCSTSPLKAHAFLMALKTIWEKFCMGKKSDILVVLAGPSDSLGASIKTPLDYSRGDARRLQGPTITAALAQFVISILVGIAVAFTTVLPVSAGTHGDSPYKRALIASCVAATLMNLYNVLDGTSHELNPNRYSASSSSSSSSPFSWKLSSVMAILRSTKHSVLTSTVVVPLVAIFASSWVAKGGVYWNMIGASFFTAAIISLYLHLFDLGLRTMLFTTPVNMKRMVEGVAEDDRLETFLDVAMYSILHSDASLVSQLSKTPKHQGFLDLEREEHKRNEEAIKVMADILLKKTSADETGAHFEEDLLRFGILSSLGGTTWNDGKSSPTSCLDDKAAAHHVENIKQWVESSDNLKVGGVSPLAVPLVRALCAYVGGLGDALLRCSSQIRSFKPSPLATSLWSLPPGVIVCAEYAIRAAARFIVWNFSHSTKTHPHIADWRSTHLSMLVPVLLNSACILEAGMVKFTQVRRYNGKQQPTSSYALDPIEKLDLIKTESPELLSLYHTCNDSATMILQKLKSLEGVRRIDFVDLDPECQKWMDNILARLPP